MCFGQARCLDHSAIDQKKAVGNGEPDCPVFMSGKQKKRSVLLFAIA